MSEDVQPPTGATARPVPRRGRGVLGPVLTIVVAVLLAVVVLAQVWTRYLWFDSVGRVPVLRTEALTQGGLFLAGALVSGALTASSLLIGHRTRPIFAPLGAEHGSADRYAVMFEPLRRLFVVLVPGLVAVLAGIGAASQWRTFLLWSHRRPFGRDDAQFGRDLGFFVFELPWWQFVTDFLLMTLALATMVAAATHYVYGGLRVGPGSRSTRAAVVHLSVLFGALALLQAVRYGLDRFALATSDLGRTSGITYTGDHALLPGKAILAAAAVVCALFFLASMRTGSWRLPIVGVSILGVCALVIGSIYPALVQWLKVAPDEAALEAPYVRRSLAATADAFGLDALERVSYDPATVAPAAVASARAASSVPVADPALAAGAFEALQAARPALSFPSPLAVDRYVVDGAVRLTLSGVRELDAAASPDADWAERHLRRTHGYGLVAASTTATDATGAPSFFAKGLPPAGPVAVTQPRVYFGGGLPAYSVVGGPAAGQEIDPVATPSSGAPAATTTYEGRGGVDIASFARRLAYAVSYREPELLVTGDIGAGSRLLDVRDPRERVARVAPWLSLDSQPYATVVDGRIVWVVDGYTTSDSFPGSDHVSLDAAAPSAAVVRRPHVGYVRNAVKATVDAYDGTVSLYAWDEEDPVLAAWRDAFPGTIEPLNAIPGSLMSHLRYPGDLFRVQRELLATHHVSDPRAFLAGDQAWRVAGEPAAAAARPTPGPTSTSGTPTASSPSLPPTYALVTLPGSRTEHFSAVSVFTTSDQKETTALLVADADAGSEPGRRRAGYGRLSLLTIPAASRGAAPAEVSADIAASTERGTGARSNQTLKQFLATAGQGGAKVARGQVTTLPVGGGVLSVQPIYVTAAGAGAVPRIEAVAVSVGEDVAWGRSLPDALAGLGAVPSTSSPAPATPAPARPAPDDVSDAIARAREAMASADAALAKRDFAAYGHAQTELRAALEDAGRLAPQKTPTPSPTGGSSPVPTASAAATPTTGPASTSASPSPTS